MSIATQEANVIEETVQVICEHETPDLETVGPKELELEEFIEGDVAAPCVITTPNKVIEATYLRRVASAEGCISFTGACRRMVEISERKKCEKRGEC
jgi:hypothetical protein